VQVEWNNERLPKLRACLFLIQELADVALEQWRSENSPSSQALCYRFFDLVPYLEELQKTLEEKQDVALSSSGHVIANDPSQDGEALNTSSDIWTAWVDQTKRALKKVKEVTDRDLRKTIASEDTANPSLRARFARALAGGASRRSTVSASTSRSTYIDTG
jgi:hypothetical protein